MFYNISDTKVKESKFLVPQIRKLMIDSAFEENMNKVEITAEKSFKNVVTNFMGIHQVYN